MNMNDETSRPGDEGDPALSLIAALRDPNRQDRGMRQRPRGDVACRRADASLVAGQRLLFDHISAAALAAVEEFA